MEIFINELSLQEQYFSDADFAEAVIVFTAIFALINMRVKSAQMYKSELFLDYKAIRGEVFQSSFQRIRNREYKELFQRIVFNKFNPRDWQLERKHSSDDVFEANGEIVTDTSIAELAERKRQDATLCGFLVNFIRSSFANTVWIDVTKNERMYIRVDCVDSQDTLQRWLDVNFLPVYTSTCTFPPRDEQTVLRDTKRFKATSGIVQHRKVYHEQHTGYYWYVDNMHYGSSAHLEVFDALGRHLGEASIEGVIDFARHDLDKGLSLS